jgi:glycerol-3-phosphate dehydrogenase
VKEFSPGTRVKNISKLKSEMYDLLVIGGGINGAGVARDAALRGMKCALIEASDYASGTSSRSSKLIHGGIRYLENFEFHLVFEALSERRKLFEIVPHLVHPLRFMIPLYDSGRVGMFKMGLGMWAYDALSLFQAPELHERLNADESLSRMPSLQTKGLLGSYIYSDAYMDDDRLVHETLRSANEASAVCANYVRAIGVEMPDGRVQKVICEDQISKEKFTIEAKHVISSVGPWTDELGQSFFKDWKPILRPTKGIHLTFRQDRLPLSSAVVMAAEARIVFGIPRHDMVIVGTTDTDFKDSPNQVHAEPEDVNYLLGVINKYFPGAEITETDIVASYAGVRPLVKDDSENENKTSREHTIFTDKHGVTYVAGGKYTTYRLMAEQTVQECLKSFPIEDRVKFSRCLTEQPLNPLVTPESRDKDFLIIEEIIAAGYLKKHEAKLLVDRHGAEALEICGKWGPASYWQLEAYQAIENTMCLHLVDFYTRRVPLVLSRFDHGLSIMMEILPVFSQKLGWNSEQNHEEQKRLNAHLEREFAWRHNLS